MWNNSKEEKEESFNTFTAKAKLINKNTFLHRQNLYDALHQTNLLTFELENSSRLVLEVPPVTFAYYIVSDTGLLTYQVNEKSAVFVKFQLQTFPPQSPPLG